MSRNNDGLPMLPPWLSESEVSDNRGYEAPVQNLPHEEYIPEEPQRRLFNRKRRKDKAEPQSPPPAEAAAPQADPRPWGTEPSPAEGDPRRDPAQGGYSPDRPPLPRRSGGEFQLPHRQPRPAPAPQAYTQPPTPQAPDVSATETTTRVPPRPERPDLPPPPPNRPPLPEPPSPSDRPTPAAPDSLPPHPDSAQSSAPQQNAPAPTTARDSAPAPDLPRPSEQPWLAAPRAPESTVPERPTTETRPAPESAVPPADQRYTQTGPQYEHQGVQPAPPPRTGADQPNQAASQAGFPTPQQHQAPESTQHFGADQPNQAAPQVGVPTPPQHRAPESHQNNYGANQTNQAGPQVGSPTPQQRQAPESPQNFDADQPNQAAPQASSPTPRQHQAPENYGANQAHQAAPQAGSPTPPPRQTPEASQNYGADQTNQAAAQVGSPTPQQRQAPESPQNYGADQAAPQVGSSMQPQRQVPETLQKHGADQANQAAPQGGFSPAPPQHQAPDAAQQPQVGFPPQQQYGQAPGTQSEAGPVQGQWQSPPAPQWGLPPQQPYLPPQHQQYPPHFQQPPGPPPSLDDVPVRRAKKSPGSGWRRAVHHMSGGAINPGMSAEERRLQELVARIRQPVRGDYRIAVLSLKGGVGKTTTTMGIGSIFASIRGDRVIAVDANPDFGTLSQRVPLQTRSTVRDLLLDSAINSYGDVRRHTSQATSRLEVLASERDPAASEAFSEDEYRQVARILQRYYNIILTDCGTGLMHSAMSGVLDLAHSLVLISSSAIDGARSAAATLDWLSLHGHDHLVRNAVVVINLPRPGSPNVGIQQLREYFLSRCRAVHIIPYDPHLSEGAEIDLARLHKNTKRALVELAATVADDFAVDHHRGRPL
ncbi:MinD/ParA family ATP-binding protein [Nocardia terpenica]|uniref:MinD/ParA family ATP-binding protein n=2 Tax=Nocardia terpenica TaxID=455432 RepID=UPI0028157540|nr:AAA family ATPase [Nocardia terpenica]